jgi:uncharacterized protein YdhG (YjbR/CyaY superfamily)
MLRNSKDRRDLRDFVGGYIGAAPKEAQPKLRQLRRTIRATVPQAKEGISYKMPYYDYHGALIWFAAFKKYVGIFIRPPIIQEHKSELKGYVTTKSAVHFPLNKPLPTALIRKLVKARAAKNKAVANKRRSE